MTTPTRRPVPTPGDLARRSDQPPAPRAPSKGGDAHTDPSAVAAQPPARTLTAEEAIAPGRLAPSERFKPTYQRGLLLSGMLPETRLMAFTLLWYSHHRSGRISPNFQPSREQLAADTGMDTGRVGVQIEILRQRGWLRLTPIAEGPRTGRPRFELAIPALYLERIRTQRIERVPYGQSD